MLRTQTHDDREEAMETALGLIDDMFDTAYTSTKTSVYSVMREMSSLWIDFESRKGPSEGKARYRLELGLWDGTIRVLALDKPDKPHIIEHK